jgi:hypothetical protein
MQMTCQIGGFGRLADLADLPDGFTGQVICHNAGCEAKYTDHMKRVIVEHSQPMLKPDPDTFAGRERVGLCA